VKRPSVADREMQRCVWWPRELGFPQRVRIAPGYRKE
jgi:hypothetical protein